jgi:hypothetical protein
MARIRSIKPEFFTSEQIAECSTTARLLFVGLWVFCDDGGVHPASLKRLKMEVFPADCITADEIGVLVEELVNQGLIETYAVDGQEFWHVTGWKHQKIDKPTYLYPRSREFGEHSTTARRALDDRSATARPRSRVESSRVESIKKPPIVPLTEEKTNGVYAGPLPAILESPEFHLALDNWLAFKKENRQEYKPMGLRQMISHAGHMAGKFGVSAIIEAMEKAMANGWKGREFDYPLAPSALLSRPSQRQR